jgi:SAM-dependent methyltransferase
MLDFARIPETGHILDIGTGTGSLAAAIAGRSRCRVSGIDVSEQFIAYARSAHASDRIHFEVGDAQQLRFPDAFFDAAVSLLVFNFIPDHRKALSEARRVVRPGASVTAAVWDYADGMKMLRIFWDAAVAVDPSAVQKDEKQMKFSRPGELSSLWKGLGFDEVDEKPLEIRMTFNSFADYWEPFSLGQGPAGAYVKGLSSGQVESLRREIVRRLPLAREDAPFSLPARARCVRGRVPRSD